MPALAVPIMVGEIDLGILALGGGGEFALLLVERHRPVEQHLDDGVELVELVLADLDRQLPVTQLGHVGLQHHRHQLDLQGPG